jgi:uncharacterized protein (DUF58 family)
MPNRRNAIYVLTILTLLAGLFTGRAFFFNLAYLLVGLLLISFLWSWLSVRWVSVGRRTRARRAQVGRTLDELFEVRNLAWLPKLWLEVRDHSELPGHRASHVVPPLGIRGKYRWQVETPCLARGEFRLGPLTLISGDPFGFFLSPRRLAATSSVIILPATVELNHFDLPLGTLSGGEARRRRAHFVTTNAAGVREYAPGDSFNRIHWRSTARKEHLMVKEFEIDPLVDIWLFVDFSASSLVDHLSVQRINRTGPVISTGPGIPNSSEEYGVVAAASVAKYLIEKLERAVGFVAYTPYREVYQPERGSRQLSRILQALAVARSLSDYSLAQMLTLETPYLTRGTTLVIVTSSLDPVWIREAQMLTRRGIRPICVFVDPASFDASRSSDELRALLQLAKIPTTVIRMGDELATALTVRAL